MTLFKFLHYIRHHVGVTNLLSTTLIAHKLYLCVFLVSARQDIDADRNAKLSHNELLSHFTTHLSSDGSGNSTIAARNFIDFLVLSNPKSILKQTPAILISQPNSSNSFSNPSNRDTAIQVGSVDVDTDGCIDLSEIQAWYAQNHTKVTPPLN